MQEEEVDVWSDEEAMIVGIFQSFFFTSPTVFIMFLYTELFVLENFSRTKDKITNQRAMMHYRDIPRLSLLQSLVSSIIR